MANTVKVTKKDNYNSLLALIAEVKPANATQLTEFIEHEIELIERKAAKASGTVSKTAQANMALAEEVFNALADCEKAVTITEFQAQFPAFAEYSNQKMSAIFKKLVDGGRVEKTIEKKKSYFSVIEVEYTEGTDEE